MFGLKKECQILLYFTSSKENYRRMLVVHNSLLLRRNHIPAKNVASR